MIGHQKLSSFHATTFTLRKLPNLNQLRSFEAAARLQSFALAALELHVTPSAVSHQMRELEAYVGRPLFTRQHRQVRCTREGLRLQETLAQVFDQLELAVREMALPEPATTLAVHCAPSFAVKWLGPRLQDFLDRSGELNLRLTTGADPVDLPIERGVDVDICYGSAPSRPGVEVVPLGREQIAPMVAPRLLAPGQPAGEALQRLRLIDSSLSPLGWRDWFDLQALPLPAGPRLSFDRAALAIAAAVDGMGIVLESTRLAERELGAGDLVLLGEPRFRPVRRATHFLCFRSDERQRPAIRAFTDWLLAATGTRSDPRRSGHPAQT
jgi:LysR family transcriptional regulator, glycine cleavage system transcriptional activator